MLQPLLPTLAQGCILQILAFMDGAHGDKKMQAIFSILVSALSTGVASAGISYDYDADPVMRRNNPKFYGYLPDNGVKRTIMYITMVCNSALLLLMRSFSTALLFLIDPRAPAIYACGDLAIYFLYKLLRRDFWHWIPVTGVTGVIVAIVERTIVKIVADFTGCLQLRGPGEIGGIYFSINIVFAIVTAMLSVPVYFKLVPASEQLVTPSQCWRIILPLSGAFVLTCLIFFSIMKKKYRSTFTSTMTGKQWVTGYFLVADDDIPKYLVIFCNPNMWLEIQPKVIDWIQEGWHRWREEQPEWFTDNWKRRVPVDWVPEEGKQEVVELRKRTGGGTGAGGSGKGDRLGIRESLRKRGRGVKITAAGSERDSEMSRLASERDDGLEGILAKAADGGGGKYRSTRVGERILRGSAGAGGRAKIRPTMLLGIARDAVWRKVEDDGGEGGGAEGGEESDEDAY
ncbi:hypothetical protein TeGR_g7765 [Tetraparma gracilis]|uniref:Uncharacterized protein n=1 Tax=Tetraparma gracilis TaxID=2962635 RepID=A0ABQ6MQF8_9STRA|nr:hypothetical protein TeGR_g7765 [Tetraparma gracilis]